MYSLMIVLNVIRKSLIRPRLPHPLRGFAMMAWGVVTVFFYLSLGGALATRQSKPLQLTTEFYKPLRKL
jgi:hypothetical protein